MLYVADFPAGNVRVTVYRNGVSLGNAQLQYYSNMEETTYLLSRIADPIDFMCQVEFLKAVSLQRISIFCASSEFYN